MKTHFRCLELHFRKYSFILLVWSPEIRSWIGKLFWNCSLAARKIRPICSLTSNLYAAFSVCQLAVPLPCTHLTSTNTNPSICRRADGRCDDVRCGGGDGGCRCETGPGVGAFSPSAGSFYAGGVYNCGWVCCVLNLIILFQIFCNVCVFSPQYWQATTSGSFTELICLLLHHKIPFWNIWEDIIFTRIQIMVCNFF